MSKNPYNQFPTNPIDPELLARIEKLAQIQAELRDRTINIYDKIIALTQGKNADETRTEMEADDTSMYTGNLRITRTFPSRQYIETNPAPGFVARYAQRIYVDPSQQTPEASSLEDNANSPQQTLIADITTMTFTTDKGHTVVIRTLHDAAVPGHSETLIHAGPRDDDGHFSSTESNRVPFDDSCTEYVAQAEKLLGLTPTETPSE